MLHYKHKQHKHNLVCLKLTWCASSWIENELNKVHKTKRIHQIFLSNLIW